MSLIALAEQRWLPDWMIRIGIRGLLKARLQDERRARDKSSDALMAQLRTGPIAIATDLANSQHYEVPAEFFETVLGPRLKYSGCLYEQDHATLAQAEEAMLELTCQRAEIEDGMTVLDLGCGWGSLSLWMAEKYPRCRITAVSNSAEQRRFIEERCRVRGLKNVQVVTANMTDFTADSVHDRIVSVEMFEHMRNYELLFSRVASWLRPSGKAFVHVFCHRDFAYLFEDAGEDDWLARHFFTGGIMPSLELFGVFKRDLRVHQRWEVNGRHYARTCEDWLVNLDANRPRLLSLFEPRYGSVQARVVLQRWRIFFMACAELFAYDAGSQWMVGHFLFEPTRLANTNKSQDYFDSKDATGVSAT